MRHILGKVVLLVSALLFSVTGAGCSSSNGGSNSLPENEPSEKPDNTLKRTDFAKGADVSWLTEMEKSGSKFYDASGKQQECMYLLHTLGMNSIRLRVWVNPTKGWNGKDDVVAKAMRAQQLGMRMMIDFHYSDTWADPSKQTVPSAWKNYDFEEMKAAIAKHTKDVLTALKEKNINVEWVQVGNETTDGMLWNDNNDALTGRASKNMANFAAYVSAGYAAVKAVYPEAKVIVHLDKGNNLKQYTWLFDGLKANGGKWDVIGMSLYPDWIENQTWEQVSDDCLNNIRVLSNKYNCDVMISEIGMVWNSNNAAPFLKKMVDGCKEISTCEGVFYWEPECNNNWNSYDKGAFDNDGRPMPSLDAFK